MTKKEWMNIDRTKEFINALLSIGYSECPKNGSSHRIFKKSGSPALSIPNDKILSTGVKRNIVKLIMGEQYYEN